MSYELVQLHTRFKSVVCLRLETLSDQIWLPERNPALRFLSDWSRAAPKTPVFRERVFEFVYASRGPRGRRVYHYIEAG